METIRQIILNSYIAKQKQTAQLKEITNQVSFSPACFPPIVFFLKKNSLVKKKLPSYFQLVFLKNTSFNIQLFWNYNFYKQKTNENQIH